MTKIFNITVAPNGARRGKADHAALPVTIPEIAQTAAACYAAGAQAIHLHVRDDDGLHSLDAGRYREAMAAVSSAAPGMDIQITTESAGIYDVAAQYECLHSLAPAAASVSVREMARDEGTAKKLYAYANEAGTDLQHILYNAGDIEQLAFWMHNGTVPADMRQAIFVLGRYNPPIHARPDDLQLFLRSGHELDLDWTICAFGPNELACARAALAAGGNVRIGFENNLHRPDGILAKDNAELIALTVNTGLELGLTPSTQLPKAC